MKDNLLAQDKKIMKHLMSFHPPHSSKRPKDIMDYDDIRNESIRANLRRKGKWKAK